MRNTDTTTNSHRGSAPVPPAAHQKAEAKTKTITLTLTQWQLVEEAIENACVAQTLGIWRDDPDKAEAQQKREALREIRNEIISTCID